MYRVMASHPERETTADRSSSEAFQLLYGDGTRIAPVVPPFNQQVIIFPFPVPMERQETLNPSRAKFTGKRKRCDKCGCDCMNKIDPPKPLPHCSICRRYHTRECWMATGGCYRCGDLGHHVRDCPKPSRKSRKFVRALAEAAESSASQEASSRVPAPVIPVPQPEAEVDPK